MIWAIVPVKTLEHAKTRLASILSPSERRMLSMVMLRDVLGALCSTRNLDRVVVVTGSVELEAKVRGLGAEVLREKHTGQNAALEDAADYCREHGASGILVVSSDLPLLRPATVEQLIAQGIQHSGSQIALLAPSHEGTGTNALFQRPSGVIPFLFGPHSLQRHQQAAVERGVYVDLVQSRGLALDVDTPADLAALVAFNEHTHTQALILQMGLLKRVQGDFYGETPVS